MVGVAPAAELHRFVERFRVQRSQPTAAGGAGRRPGRPPDRRRARHARTPAPRSARTGRPVPKIRAARSARRPARRPHPRAAGPLPRLELTGGLPRSTSSWVGPTRLAGRDHYRAVWSASIRKSTKEDVARYREQIAKRKARELAGARRLGAGRLLMAQVGHGIASAQAICPS